MAKQSAAMSGLQPYPAYKPSGVEWLGDVPSHWEVRRLRTIAEMRVSNVDKHVREGEPSVRLCNYVDVYNHDHISQQIDFMRATATCKEIEQFRLEKDDVLITKDSEAWDDIGVPAVVAEPAEDLISGYHLALLRPVARVLIGSFLLRALQSKGAAYQFHVEAKGVTRYGLSHTSIKSTWIALPPVPEQAAIASYLDHADRRIQRCIQEKEKLVKLLEEQRQALINEAVTGRVDVRTGQPYPAYKPSGVEWLGDVPTHWDVQQLGRMGTLSKGNGGSKADEASAGVPCVRYGDLYTTHTRFIKSSRAFVSQARAADYTPLKHGDILFAASGETIDEIGKSAVNLILSGACCGGDIIVFRSKYRTHAPFMGYVTDCWSSAMQKATMGRGFTVVHIYATQLKQLLLPVPPHSEQAAIARYLDHAERRIQRYVESEQRQIHLLNEYRSRLIADLVTGKLDVLQAASGLPNELEDPGAIT